MRKLAWFAVFFAAAALFVFLIPESIRTVLWIMPPVLIGTAFAVFRKRLTKEKHLLILRTALLGFGIGCLYVMLWQLFAQRELLPLLDRERTVEAVVLEESSPASYGLRTDIRIGRTRCTLFTDRSALLEAGQRIRVHAVFRSTLEKTNSDYYLTLGVPLFAYAREAPEILGPAKASWRFVPARVGSFLRERIKTVFDSQTAGFLLAVLTGDRTQLRHDTWFSSMLRASGAAHCVAVSGMHLSFLMMFLYVLFGRGRVSAIACIPVTLLFMAMTGFSASVVRAGVMQLAVCGAKLTRKQYDSLSALGLALLLLLLVNPYSIRNAGLLLSFASTLGILLFYPKIKDGLPVHPEKWGKHSLRSRLWNSIEASLAISLASAVFTVPLTALFFRQICLLSPLTNLLILWAVSLCFLLGLLGTLVSLVSLTAGMLFRWPLGLLVGYIKAVVCRIGSLPVSTLYIRGPYLICWLIVTWLGMGLCCILRGIPHRLRAFVLFACFGLAIFLGLAWLEPHVDTHCFAVLDVGQGQCLALTGPEGVTLIDCGGSQSANAGDLAAEYLFSQGRFRADNLILTHFHQDHVNGVQELLRRVPVKTLYCPYPEAGDREAEDLLAFAAEKGTSIVYLEKEILWRRWDGMELAIVPPLNQLKENESGLCIAVNAGSLSLLCTGDAGSGTELRLLERMRIENLSLLIAGHHGSAGSVSKNLLQSVRPKAVAISVGRNSYGLPSEKTLTRIRETGAVIYRTDEQGDIILHEQREVELWGK